MIDYIIDAIKVMRPFSQLAFSNNGKISRFCRIKNAWIIY